MKAEARLELGELQRRISPSVNQFAEPFEVRHLRPDRLEVLPLQVFRPAFYLVREREERISAHVNKNLGKQMIGRLARARLGERDKRGWQRKSLN